jgi:hypothetical protein
MRILSLEAAADLLGASDMGSFVSEVDWQYPNPVPSYFLPDDSGAKVGLARVIANTFLDRGVAILWLTEFGIWSSAEHVDLFTRYRLSYGETRTISEAPIHVFESTEDRDAFTSILCLGLFFVWGFEVISRNRSLAMTISHDEWLEYRFAPGEDDFTLYFEKWIAPSLRPGVPTTDEQ